MAGLRLRGALAALRGAQHRNALYLMLNAVTGALAGVLFWLLLTRVAGLPAAEVGIGYTIVAVGTTIGLLAKGGLDTALLRAVPRSGRTGAFRLLAFATFLGCSIAALLTVTLWLAAGSAGGINHLHGAGWLLAAGIGFLLVVTWLQDAYFLAEGDARWSFRRNLVFSAGRLLLPLPVVALALPLAVPLTWLLALGASALAAFGFGRTLAARPAPESGDATRGELVQSATRNVLGSAAEFLPGLLLAPLVLAAEGPEQAAYFGIAWTAASILFLMSSAVSRSALAELVRHPAATRVSILRAVKQNTLIVAPAALAGIVLAPVGLGFFGPEYARNGSTLLILLCASLVAVAPSYLYLSLLRAREQPLGLVLFPLLLVFALLAAAPPLMARHGLPGVGAAWMLANLPLGAFAAWRLWRETKEVTLAEPAPVARRADAE